MHADKVAAKDTTPDGSLVRTLGVLPNVASFAQFELAPNQASQALSHGSVQEIWYVVSGSGELWRSLDSKDDKTRLEPGVCVTIPAGTSFQSQAGNDGLQIVAVTIPPWPGNAGEARQQDGPWRVAAKAVKDARSASQGLPFGPR
ncbi:cupin domain-containing protein [Streptomyces sp. NPDC002088]|uniref:cupin domain-containing protein n=1 Tax=Streptomyces sp. NPDC002088 TaxID=3154665 RepID=UPI003326B18E